MDKKLIKDCIGAIAAAAVENKRDEILEAVDYYLEKQGRRPLYDCLDDDLLDALRADILRILM